MKRKLYSVEQILAAFVYSVSPTVPIAIPGLGPLGVGIDADSSPPPNARYIAFRRPRLVAPFASSA